MTTINPFSRTALLCGTALSLFVAPPLLAQEDDSEIISLDPIEVRRRDPEGEAADRTTAVYVSDAGVERASLGDAKDLFQGIANVQVGGAIPLTQKIYVNGIDLTNLTTQIDGTLQNNRVFHHTATNVFDPGMLKFVRVDPGIAAADTGPNAVAGAVIMETIGADDILESGQVMGGNFRLGYADNGDTASGSLTLATRSSGFEALLYGRTSNGNNYTDGSGTERQGTASDFNTGLVKLAYESDDGHRIEFSGQQVVDSDLRNEKPNFGNWAPPYTMALVPYDTKRSSYSLRYRNTKGGGMWDPEAIIGYSKSEVSRLDRNYDGVSDTASAKFQNTFHFDNGTVVAGLDYYDKGSTFSDPTYSLSETAKNVGVFAQARFDLSDAWRISGGARFDSQKFEGVDGTKFDDSGASGNLSLTYFVNDNWSLRAGYSNVFGGYQVEDNYKFWDTDYSGLKSSRGENINIGVDYNIGSLNIGVEGFITKIDNARMMAWDRTVGGNVNSGADVESKGFNIGATYDWNLGSMRMTYTHADLTVDGENPGTYDAQHFGFGTPVGQRLALEVQQYVPNLNTLFGASLDMAFQNDSTATCSTCSALEEYTVVNVFAEYSPPSLSNVTIRASVNNLFDEGYSDRATYGQDYTESLVAMKEPGRTLLLEAVIRF